MPAKKPGMNKNLPAAPSIRKKIAEALTPAAKAAKAKRENATRTAKAKTVVPAKPTATSKPRVTTKPTMPKKEKPAVGADIAAKKKYGPNSHNNGYTN